MIGRGKKRGVCITYRECMNVQMDVDGHPCLLACFVESERWLGVQVIIYLVKSWITRYSSSRTPL